MEITEKMVREFALDILFFPEEDFNSTSLGGDIRETTIRQMLKAHSFFQENGISLDEIGGAI